MTKAEVIMEKIAALPRANKIEAAGTYALANTVGYLVGYRSGRKGNISHPVSSGIDAILLPGHHWGKSRGYGVRALNKEQEKK